MNIYAVDPAHNVSVYLECHIIVDLENEAMENYYEHHVTAKHEAHTKKLI